MQTTDRLDCQQSKISSIKQHTYVPKLLGVEPLARGRLEDMSEFAFGHNHRKSRALCKNMQNPQGGRHTQTHTRGRSYNKWQPLRDCQSSVKK